MIAAYEDIAARLLADLSGASLRRYHEIAAAYPALFATLNTRGEPVKAGLGRRVCLACVLEHAQTGTFSTNAKAMG